MEPHYNFDDLMDACSSGRDVFVHVNAQRDAAECFNLPTRKRLLDFIANNGLEHRKFINSKPWEKNPNPDTTVMVDSYDFYSGKSRGYFAFFRAIGGAWIIKSFKKNDDPDDRFFPFEGLAGLLNTSSTNKRGEP